ncbi:unnamed protein product [Cladocopium goreaui]|uniref:ATP-dependent DNA helicase n=1 Tax=Cladocopium goreaui TaxID=2562237 RepID=A0A9P1FYM2_9DINO|nr:unnamed protein product [Cladocopium goreaui]
MKLALLMLGLARGEQAVCPGEGARYEDFKCNHDPTHRVCAQLLDGEGQPLDWGAKGNFWQITGQEAFQWDSEIRENHGDSWCICMWATARLIATVGCENVHLRCDATDVAYVEKSYVDGGVNLQPAKKCLQQKCPGLSLQRLDDAVDVSDAAERLATASAARIFHLALPAAAALLMLALLALRVAYGGRSAPVSRPEIE